MMIYDLIISIMPSADAQLNSSGEGGKGVMDGRVDAGARRMILKPDSACDHRVGESPSE